MGGAVGAFIGYSVGWGIRGIIHAAGNKAIPSEPNENASGYSSTLKELKEQQLELLGFDSPQNSRGGLSFGDPIPHVTTKPVTITAKANPRMGWYSKANIAAGMFFMWASGKRLPFGMGQYYNNDGVANSFRNASGIIKAREDFYSKRRKFGRVPFGAKGYWNAKDDPIESFVGSFDYQIHVTENSLQFTITNRTSVSSFVPHPQGIYIWPESWNPTSGPFSNFYQTYIFNEPIRR